MDPSDKNRLWSLLSEERSIRFEVQNKALQVNNERNEQAKAVKSDEEKGRHSEIFTEIDTSPITSPENIRRTRGRLSRLLLSNKKIRDGLDEQNISVKGDSFVPFLRDNVILREDKASKIKGSVRFHEPKSLTKQSSSIEFVRPTPEAKPVRMTRSLSPTPSKLNMNRLKMRSFDDDTDSLYNHRLSKSIKRSDIAPKRGQESSLSAIQPIRTVSLDSPLLRPVKSTAQTKPKDRYGESTGELDFNVVKDNIRRPIKAGIDDRAVFAMEMDAFVRSQQNLSSLMSRIEEVKVEAAIYMLFGNFAEIFSPIGCSRLVLYKSHTNMESPPELIHTFPDGRSIPLDGNTSSCILQAANFKSSGNLNSPMDAIFSTTSTISPHSVYWNEFCIAASVGEDEVCDSCRCILSVPIHVDGKVTAIVLVTVDRSNSIIFDGVGSKSSNPMNKIRWQDTMTLQLLQQLKYFLEKKISSVQSHAVLSSMNRDLAALANKDFIHSHILSALQTLNLSSGGVIEVVSNMLHAVGKLGLAVSGTNSEAAAHGHRQQHPCWMLIEQYGSSQFGQSVGIFSVTDSSDERSRYHSIHVRPIKVDSKSKKLKADDMFGGKMMHARSINSVSQEDIDHFRTGLGGDCDSTFSRLSSDSSVVVVPFIAPFQVTGGSIQICDSSQNSVRCVLCLEVPTNESFTRNRIREDAEEDRVALTYLEHIVSQTVPTITKLQSEMNSSLQAKFQQVLRIVHHASTLKGPTVDPDGSNKSNLMYLLQFVNAVQSEQASKCFGVRRLALLVSNAFLSDLDFQQSYPLEQRDDFDYITPTNATSSTEGILRVSSRRNSIMFTQSTGTTFQTIVSCDADLGTDSWLQELFNGNAVHFSAGSVDYGTSLQSQHDRSTAKLKALVSSVDSSAVSAVLLPLRSAMGLCILILFDKLNDVAPDHNELPQFSTVTDQNTATASHYRLFSNFYIQSIQNSGVCGDLIDALHNMRTITHSETKSIKGKADRDVNIAAWQQSHDEKVLEIQKLERRFEKLLSVIPKYSKKEILHNFLRRWKLFVSNRVVAVRNKKFSLLLEGIKELIKVKIDCKEADLLQKFFSIFEKRLGTIFPLDNVSVSYDAAIDVNDSHDLFVGSEQHDLDDSYGQLSVRKSVLKGTVTYSHISQLARSRKQSVEDNQTHTIAGVSVTRKSTNISSIKRFEPDEVSLFHEFCGVASDLYSALHRGVQDDFSPGHARSLVFPMLREIVPAMLPSDTDINGKGFEAAAIQKASTTESLLSLLSRWLKRMTNAEIVTINLRASGIGGGADSAIGALHCTSEDTPLGYSQTLDTERSFRDFLSTDTISSDHNHLRILLKADDSAVAQSTSSEFKSSRLESDIRIHFPQNRSTPISDEQIGVVEVVSYLLVYSLRNNRTHQKLLSETASLRDELDKVSEKLSSAQREASLLGASDSIVKFRLSAAVSAQEFMNEIYTLESLPDLARYVSNMIPRLFGAESAVLVLKEFAFASNSSTKSPHDGSLFHGSGSSTTARVDDQEKFFVVLPLNDDDSDNSKLENLGKRKALTASKLAKIDHFFHHRTSTQSKIELRNSINSKSRKRDDHLFGAILLFESDSLDRLKVEGRWEGLEDVITRSISSSIYHCTQRFGFIHQIDTLTREGKKMQEVLQDKLQLESNFESLLQSESAFKKQRDDLSSQVSVLNEQLRTVVKEKESLVSSFEQEVKTWKSKYEDNEEELLRSTAALEESMQQIQDELSSQRQHHSTLMDVIRGYVLDSRCSSKDTVIDWLRDTAEYLKLSLAVVSQSETGDMDGFSGIRGAAAAVGEALRTGQIVEFSSTAAKNSNKGRLRSGVTEYLEKAARSTVNLDILCVPNRLVLSQSKQGATEIVCFLFIREHLGTLEQGDGEPLFSQIERDTLTCGADLACRVLLKNTVKYSVEDFNRLETHLASELKIKNNLRLTIKCAEKLLFREHNTKSELVRAIEDAAKSLLLSLSTETDVFNITVDTKLHFTPIATSAVINESSSSIEFEAMSKVLRSGRALRKAGMLIVPISDAKSQICAILSCEKKLSAASSSIELLDKQNAEMIPVSKKSAMPDISDLLMTDLDEEAVSILCFLVLPLLDKLNCLTDAYSGIQQAGQAIIALQQINAEIEDKLASAIAQRVAVESTMQCGLDIITAHFKPRMTAVQLLNVTRAAVLSVTSSSHCFVVLPAEVVHKNCDELNKLITVDDETIVDVHMDDIDIETSVLESTKRSYNDPSDRLDNNDSIHSWSVRRVQSKRQHPQVSEFYYIQVIPIYVRRYGSEDMACGFISTLRKAAKYSLSDRDSVSWIGQVLSLCLEQCIHGAAEEGRLKATEEDTVMSRVSEYVVRIEQLEKEAKELAKLESLRKGLEEDARLLLEDLSVRFKNMQLDPIAVIDDELIKETIHAVFGNQSTYKSWQYSNAIDAFEFTFQLDSLANNSEAAANSSFCKDNVTFGNISATLWVDSDSTALQSMLRSSFLRLPHQQAVEGEEETDLQHRLQGLLRTVHGGQYFHALNSPLRHKATIVLLFKGSQKGEGDRWIVVSSVPESLSSIKIRLCMMMNILSGKMEWKKKVDQLNESIYQSSEKVKNMEYKLMVEKEVHQSDIEKGGIEVQKVKEVCKVTLERAKDKYKALIREMSQQRSSVEGVLVEATAFSSRLRRQFKSRYSRRSIDQQWLQTALIDLAGTLSTLTNMEMSVELVSRDMYEESWNESENIRHGSSKTFDLALKHSVSSNRIVIAATETGKWETRLSTLYSLFYDNSSRENNTVLVLPNEDGDACFVPILFSSTSSKVFVVRVFFSKNHKEKVELESLARDSASANSHFFGALLVAWISTKESILSMCNDAETSWKLKERAQVTALKTIRMSYNLRTLRDMMPHHVFEVLKSMRLRAKLRSALSSEPELLAKLQEVKFQVRNLERSSADWKELVVGLNASTIGIMEGVPGLWAKACRSLLSILSSSLSLRGCGLIILSNDSDPAPDAKEVADERKRGSRRDRSSNRSGRKLSSADSDMLELAVRELITPAMGASTSERSFNLPLPSYAKDVIEIRGVNELGRAVENLALEIFNTGSATQRIFKLSRTAAQDYERSNSEERLWLVPIKGAHSIMGLLRVSFSLPKEPFSPSTPISTIVKPMEFDSERRIFSDDISGESVEGRGRTGMPNSNVERVLETAENNTINFADMLGPLLHAAAQLSKEQTAKQHLQILAQNESAHLVAARKEEGLAKHKLSVLLEVIDSVGRVEVKAMTSSSDDEQSVVVDWNISIEEYSSQIASALSAALRVRVKIVLESIFLIDQETLSFSTAQAIISKQPADSISLKDKENNIYGYMSWMPMNSDAVPVVDSEDSRVMIEILSVVGSLVSGAITRAVRNLQLQLLVSKAKRTAQSTENALQLEQVVGFELQQKEEELSSLNELYRALADILHQCLLFNAKLPLEMKSLQAEFGEIPIVEHRLSQSILLLELLRGLCERLPRVVGDKSCLFSFAVVDGQLRVPVIPVEEPLSERPRNPTIASAAAVHNMAWVYSSSNSANGSGVSLKDLPLSAKEMASNLAQITLSKRQKSSFDITFPRDDQSANPNSNSNQSTTPVNYRIVTIPLKNMTIRSKRKSKNFENIPLGVMQVFIDLAERKGEEEVERLCEDIASAVSCALSQDVFYQQLAALLEIKDIQQQVVEGKTDELSSDMHKNQQISKLWQAVSNFSVIIIRYTCALQFSSSSAFVDKAAVGSPTSRSVAQLITSEEVTSCLFETGISLALVTGEINGSISVPLGGSSNTHVSIQCTGADNILEPQLLQSCAEVVCTMIRSAVILEQNISLGNRDSRKRDNNTSKLIEKLKAAVIDGKQDATSLRAIVADQSRSLQFLEESLTNSHQLASNMIPKYVLPTVGDFSAVLTAYSLLEDNDSDIYQTIIQVANSAMHRLAGNREGSNDRHHLTLFLREGSHHDSRLRLKAYTHTASGGSITLPASSNSLITKCFAFGGVHSKNIQSTSSVTREESNFDFLGLDSAVESKLLDSANKSVTVCCASLPPDCEFHPVAVLRLVMQSSEDDKQSTVMRPIFEQLLNILAALSGALLATHKVKLGSLQKVSSVTAQLKKEHEQTLSALTVGSKMKKLQKGICREAITLLDPPMTDNGVGLAVHPATLTPMGASLDVCLKLLSMVHSLLRASGQAILLKNPTESEVDGTHMDELGSHGSTFVNSFQVIYTGDTLAWPGVNPGSFGLVAGSPSSSLVNVVMSTKEPLVVADITADGRYCPLIDGVVAKGTSVLMVPIRGRGGLVVGVLIAAKPTADVPHSSKKRGKAVSFDLELLPFSYEDVSAAETCAALGALSLYWCQGLGSVQRNLLRSIDKMERLEATVQRLQPSKALTALVSDVPAGVDVHAQKAGATAKVKSKGKIK